MIRAGFALKSFGRFLWKFIVGDDLTLAIGVLLGAILGTHFLHRFTATSIRTVFIVVLVFVSAQMLLKGVGIYH